MNHFSNQRNLMIDFILVGDELADRGLMILLGEVFKTIPVKMAMRMSTIQMLLL